MRNVVIVAAKRTAIGSFGGSLKDVSAVELGASVVTDLLNQTGVSPDLVEEVIFGNVLQAGLGQNVARQVSMKAGLPKEVPSFTVNKVCGSGLKAVQLAAQSIACGDAEIVVAGGTENMSQAPYIMPKARWGARMGDTNLIDTMTFDGLTDIFSGKHMGITAENIAELYTLDRAALDDLAATSQQRAEVALQNKRFADEIVPISIPQRKGDPIVVDTDEFPRPGVTAESIGKLRPAFKADGVVTAANSSGINDGAAALLLMSEDKAKELGLTPLVRIVASASAGVDPSIMGTGPIPATQRVLKKANWTVADLELIEANEAFAAQALSVIKDLNFNTDIVNVNGGAIALGHPIGASGARILVSLIHEMLKRDVHKGLATLCIGGGQGIAMVVER